MHGHAGVTLHSGVPFSVLVSAVNPMRMLLLSSCLFVGGLARLQLAEQVRLALVEPSPSFG